MDAVLKPDSQMAKIYHAIARQESLSDEDILRTYPEIGDADKLASLKAKLKNRLSDAVFLLDYREGAYPDRQEAFVDCLKRWSAAMILINKNIRSVGIKQLEALLRQTLQFEFTELSMNIMRTLELYYGTVEGDHKKYSDIERQLEELENIWLAERAVEKRYSDLLINYVNSRSDKHLAAQKAEEFYKSLEPALKQYPAFKIQFFGYLIHTILYDSRNDYAGMEKVCQDAIHFFNLKPYRSGMVEQTFYYNLVTCYLILREFEKGAFYIKKIEHLLPDNSFNWFKLKELYFVMAMHAGQYQESWISLQQVLNSPFFKIQPSVIVETWKIFEAYTYFLISIGLLTAKEIGNEQIHFKISRFMNEVPQLSKDKRGMNVAIQIIQFLFLIVTNKQDDCMERVEGLNKYCNRYLNEENTMRSWLFIKILIQIPLNNFDVSVVKQKTQKNYDLMMTKPWHSVNQHREVEVIPYEDLWPQILKTIDKTTNLMAVYSI